MFIFVHYDHVHLHICARVHAPNVHTRTVLVVLMFVLVLVFVFVSCSCSCSCLCLLYSVSLFVRLFASYILVVSGAHACSSISDRLAFQLLLFPQFFRFHSFILFCGFLVHRIKLLFLSNRVNLRAPDSTRIC